MSLVLPRLLLVAASVLLAGPLHAQTPASPAAAPRVKLATTAGDIVLQLEAEKAPRTVANFLANVNRGHYNGTIFHRVIDGFMIQGGGFDTRMVEKPASPPIENEARNGLKNDKYTVAMARTPNPHSASAQFFINVADNVFLNHTAPTPQGWGYAVFGKVIEGQDAIDRIRAVRTGNQGMHQNVPLTPIVINSATVLK